MFTAELDMDLMVHPQIDVALMIASGLQTYSGIILGFMDS